MKSRFKSNNFIAILLAIILFTIGFVLAFIHTQSKSAEADAQAAKTGFNHHAMHSQFNARSSRLSQYQAESFFS